MAAAPVRSLTKVSGGCLGRTPVLWPMLGDMETGSVHVRLTIDLGSDPISGAVEVADREPMLFRGWIDLVSAIEDARASVTATKTLGCVPGAKLGERQLT
jgi:hypothetical protein